MIFLADKLVKTFPGVRALDGASLALEPGTVHAMLGENGVLPPLPSRPVCTCSSEGKRQNSISQVVLVEGIRIPKCRGMTSFLPSFPSFGTSPEDEPSEAVPIVRS